MEKVKNLPRIDILFVALAMSLGWGIRGNYGHEYGAMIPGVLGALAVCLVSGRKDWHSRFAWFGLFGALGWAFGGQMSYGIIIGYTRSLDFTTLVYGFGALFLEGLVWGGIGAGVLALVILLPRDKIKEIIFPFLMIILVWMIVDRIQIRIYGEIEPDALNYFDTDWIATVGALLALILTLVIKRKITYAISFLLHLTIGWLLSVCLFVSVLGWHLSPPRSDNWAGALGVLLGLTLFFIRRKEWAALYASLIVGLFSGLGFSTGQLFAVLGTATGINIDWWKVMEQTFGLFAGIGMGIGFMRLRHVTPKCDEDTVNHDWTNGFALFFVLIVVTFINFQRNVGRWVEKDLITAYFGLSPEFWFVLAYLFIAIIVLTLIVRLKNNSIPLIPESAEGRGGLLFLLFLWWAVIGDQFGSLIQFNDARLVVEGSFFLSAVLLSAWLVIRPTEPMLQPDTISDVVNYKLKRHGVFLFIALVFIMFFYATIAQVSHSEPFGGSHIRFEKPAEHLNDSDG